MMMDEVKQQIMLAFPRLDPCELDGLRKEGEGYLTANQKWLYLLRADGIVERHRLMKPGWDVDEFDALMSGDPSMSCSKRGTPS